VLECIATEGNGGTWSLTDPNGVVVADDLEMTAGSGTATVFTVGGLTFTLTDGSGDFDAGDTFTLGVTGNGALVPFAPNGTGGAQHPFMVASHETVSTGAATVSVRPIVAGEVNRDRLIIHADGDGDNITTAHVDALRDLGIIATSVQQ